MVVLPGLGETRRVRIWLPALRGCAVRQLWGNGSFFEPVERHEQLLVIGDSVAQGFVTGDPALAWPSLLAVSLGIDVVNQGLGGQVFQPSSLVGLSAYVNPSCIVVALGENYRYEPCRHRPTARDVRNHLVEVARLWPDVPTYVCTPLWHDEEQSPSHRMSCWRRVPSMIEANAAVHDEMVLVDGLRIVDHDPSSFSDVHGHLNADGAAQVARYLELIMCHVSLDEPMLRERAMKLRADAPRQSLPIVEMLRLGMGEVIYAEEGCVLLRLDDQLVASVSDHDAAAAAIAMLSDDRVVFVDDLDFGKRLSRTLGLPDMTPISVALYRRKVKPRISPEQQPVTLKPEHLADIHALCADLPWATDEVLESTMAQQALLGTFSEDELVGLIAELPDGSLTLPVIREGHTGEGWERALIAAQVVRLQKTGRLPWLLVERDDEELLRTLRSVGMSVGSADECCLLSKPKTDDEEPATI
ncbi:MAG: SGNH/GDSL hydrolase family protein, partial [Atopobiaceae bacterium]|nr:SGNH/GDSL hydrolase family protein [Atopobiaceae bacterium]